MLLLSLKWHFNSTDISCLKWVSRPLTSGIKESGLVTCIGGENRDFDKSPWQCPHSVFSVTSNFPPFLYTCRVCCFLPRRKPPDWEKMLSHCPLGPSGFHAGPYSAWVGILVPPAKLSPVRNERLAELCSLYLPPTGVLYTRTAPGIFCWEGPWKTVTSIPFMRQSPFPLSRNPVLKEFLPGPWGVKGDSAYALMCPQSQHGVCWWCSQCFVFCFFF